MYDMLTLLTSSLYTCYYSASPNSLIVCASEETYYSLCKLPFLARRKIQLTFRALLHF